MRDDSANVIGNVEALLPSLGWKGVWTGDFKHCWLPPWTLANSAALKLELKRRKNTHYTSITRRSIKRLRYNEHYFTDNQKVTEYIGQCLFFCGGFSGVVTAPDALALVKVTHARDRHPPSGNLPSCYKPAVVLTLGLPENSGLLVLSEETKALLEERRRGSGKKRRTSSGAIQDIVKRERVSASYSSSSSSSSSSALPSSSWTPLSSTALDQHHQPQKQQASTSCPGRPSSSYHLSSASHASGETTDLEWS